LTRSPALCADTQAGAHVRSSAAKISDGVAALQSDRDIFRDVSRDICDGDTPPPW